jgi:hypothetical protein
MTPLEIVLTIIVVVVVIIAIYYYFKGAKGKISITKPMESRVDEYLDRRFESIVTEWALVQRPAVKRFREKNEPQLDKNEAAVSDLGGFEQEITSTLNRLEERLDYLEKDIAQTK